MLGIFLGEVEFAMHLNSDLSKAHGPWTCKLFIVLPEFLDFGHLEWLGAIVVLNKQFGSFAWRIHSFGSDLR